MKKLLVLLLVALILLTSCGQIYYFEGKVVSTETFLKDKRFDADEVWVNVTLDNDAVLHFRGGHLYRTYRDLSFTFEVGETYRIIYYDTISTRVEYCEKLTPNQ